MTSLPHVTDSIRRRLRSLEKDALAGRRHSAVTGGHGTFHDIVVEQATVPRPLNLLPGPGLRERGVKVGEVAAQVREHGGLPVVTAEHVNQLGHVVARFADQPLDDSHGVILPWTQGLVVQLAEQPRDKNGRWAPQDWKGGKEVGAPWSTPAEGSQAAKAAKNFVTALAKNDGKLNNMSITAHAEKLGPVGSKARDSFDFYVANNGVRLADMHYATQATAGWGPVKQAATESAVRDAVTLNVKEGGKLHGAALENAAKKLGFDDVAVRDMRSWAVLNTSKLRDMRVEANKALKLDPDAPAGPPGFKPKPAPTFEELKSISDKANANTQAKIDQEQAAKKADAEAGVAAAKAAAAKAAPADPAAKSPEAEAKAAWQKSVDDMAKADDAKVKKDAAAIEKKVQADADQKAKVAAGKLTQEEADQLKHENALDDAAAAKAKVAPPLSEQVEAKKAVIQAKNAVNETEAIAAKAQANADLAESKVKASQDAVKAAQKKADAAADAYWAKDGADSSEWSAAQAELDAAKKTAEKLQEADHTAVAAYEAKAKAYEAKQHLEWEESKAEALEASVAKAAGGKVLADYQAKVAAKTQANWDKAEAESFEASKAAKQAGGEAAKKAAKVADEAEFKAKETGFKANEAKADADLATAKATKDQDAADAATKKAQDAASSGHSIWTAAKAEEKAALAKAAKSQEAAVKAQEAAVKADGDEAAAAQTAGGKVLADYQAKVHKAAKAEAKAKLDAYHVAEEASWQKTKELAAEAKAKLPKVTDAVPAATAKAQWEALSPHQKTSAEQAAGVAVTALQQAGKDVTVANLTQHFKENGGWDTSAVSKGAYALVSTQPSKFGLGGDDIDLGPASLAAAGKVKQKAAKKAADPKFGAADSVAGYNDQNLPVLKGTKDASTVKQPAIKGTAAENHALTEYHDGTYSEQNKNLRSGGTPTKADGEMTALISRHRTPDDVTVYRGMRSVDPAQLKPGLMFADHGFASTDVAGGTAISFSGGNVLMAIHVPAGSQGVYKNNQHKEKELVLQRGTVYQVVGMISGGVHGPTIYQVEVVSQPTFKTTAPQAPTPKYAGSQILDALAKKKE